MKQFLEKRFFSHLAHIRILCTFFLHAITDGINHFTKSFHRSNAIIEKVTLYTTVRVKLHQNHPCWARSPAQVAVPQLSLGGCHGKNQWPPNPPRELGFLHRPAQTKGKAPNLKLERKINSNCARF